MRRLVPLLLLLTCAVARADDPTAAIDAEGCKDHPLWTRLPGYHLSDCAQSQFDRRDFPVGKGTAEGGPVASESVEGPTWRYTYYANEGTTPASPLQVMRNFVNAARKAGGAVVAEYADECTLEYDVTHMPDMGNSCLNYAAVLKVPRSGKEYWTFVNSSGDSYMLTLTERAAMKQDVAVNELVDKLNKDGFIALYVNFDTGKATIKPDSAQTLDDAAAALAAAPDLKIEVGGHTDNIGDVVANQKLSEDRARAVMAALVARGVAAARLTARGYGQSAPVADNRSEEGRAKNRRVELTKR